MFAPYLFALSVLLPAGEDPPREEVAADSGHWAFQPPKRPAQPVLSQASWVRDALDTFVLARLERAGVQGRCGPVLNPESDPAEWLAKPGAPKSRLANEKPAGQTVRYDQLIQAWREGRAR